jgi:hypothetical protein
MADHRAIRLCDWCRRWERADEWVTMDLDDTVPGVVLHAICPACAAGVLRGEADHPHAPADQVESLLRQGEALGHQAAQQRGVKDDWRADPGAPQDDESGREWPRDPLPGDSRTG